MYVLTCLHLPHALTESQFDQSALSALLLCFVIPGFLAMGWQFVKSWRDLASSVATEVKSVPSASSAMKLVNEEAAKRADSEEEGGSGLDVQRAEEGAARKAETELSPQDDAEFQVTCYATTDVNGV